MIGILDLQHGRQHVWEAGHKVVRDPKKTAAWVTPRTQAIWDGKVDDVIVDLAAETGAGSSASWSDRLNAIAGVTFPAARE